MKKHPRTVSKFNMDLIILGFGESTSSNGDAHGSELQSYCCAKQPHEVLSEARIYPRRRQQMICLMAVERQHALLSSQHHAYCVMHTELY